MIISASDELRNFEELARFLKPSPGEIPAVPGIDIHGISLPLRGELGGDHTIYVDFQRRYDLDARIDEATAGGRQDVVRRLRALRRQAGILVVDVCGHRITDAAVAAMVHQAFLLGLHYELDLYGEVTTRIFEHINTRFHRTTAVNKYFTMIYGEISEGGRFRFLSAGHQPPAVFSREFGRFMRISPDRLVSFPPVGLLPSGTHADDRRVPGLYGYTRRYEVNEINLLAVGDILLLHTDGLSEHDEGRFFPARTEQILAELREESAERICERIRAELLARAEPVDDITFVVIRKTA